MSKESQKIRVGNKLINAPIMEIPKRGARYWVVGSAGDVAQFVWWDAGAENGWLKAGNCWHTKKDAQAYAKAAREQRKTIVKENEA